MVSDENIHFLLLAAGCATALFLMVGALALQLFLLSKGVQKQRQLCKARQENDKAERNQHDSRCPCFLPRWRNVTKTNRSKSSRE